MEPKFIISGFSYDHGWKKTNHLECSAYYKGYLHNKDISKTAEKLIETFINSEKFIATFLAELEGNFSFVIQSKSRTLLVCDQIRSIPLIYYFKNNSWIASDTGRSLIKDAELSLSDVDITNARIMKMSGFAISDSTIYRDVKSIQPGRYVILSVVSGQPLARQVAYASYKPWLTDRTKTDQQWLSDAKNQLRELIQNTAVIANDRKILLPLSAGLDSRLIASGLKEVGYKDVVCFSYGLKGNFEAAAAKRIAEKLGYPWHFIELTPAKFRSIRSSSHYQGYLEYANALSAVPTEQDSVIVSLLKEEPWASKNPIIINGQSGDFITGGHIPESLLPQNINENNSNDIFQIFLKETLQKHFNLWPHLQSEDNINCVREKLFEELIESGVPLNHPDTAYAVYEYSEFCNRQAKYVVNGQRAYDYFGYDWLLPLWEPNMIRFWQSVPPHLKYKQKLYRQALWEMNWGDVWQNLSYDRWIVPRWVRPLRSMAKAACIIAGKDAWHRLERRFFAYHMDVICNYGAVDWTTIALTNKDHRNPVSWINNQYLLSLGVSEDWLEHKNEN